MGTLFALVLTVCTPTDCDDYIIDMLQNKSDCTQQLAVAAKQHNARFLRCEKAEPENS